MFSFGGFIASNFGGVFAPEFARVATLFSHAWLAIIIVSYIVSFAGMVVIVYTLIRIHELRTREELFYGTVIAAPESKERNLRFEKIQELVAGTPSEWRQAIIEADVMLDDMLREQGYAGAGVGEKLSQVERSDFATLNDAWEAHKVRNQIAHEGSGFDLSETLARRTIARYENVFREFGLI